MAKREKKAQVEDYRHDEKRKNNPPIGMASYESKVGKPKMNRYAYDPHLSPQLVWAGKYDEYGNRQTVDIAGCAMALQKIETIDEPASRGSEGAYLFRSRPIATISATC